MGERLWDLDYSYCWYIGMGYGRQAMDYSYIGMGMGYRLWVMDCMYLLVRWGVTDRNGLGSMVWAMVWAIGYGLWDMDYNIKLHSSNVL